MINDRNYRAVRAAAAWYESHLLERVGESRASEVLLPNFTRLVLIPKTPQGSVQSPSFDKPLMILDRENISRSIHGAQVVFPDPPTRSREAAF